MHFCAHAYFVGVGVFFVWLRLFVFWGIFFVPSGQPLIFLLALP